MKYILLAFLFFSAYLVRIARLRRLIRFFTEGGRTVLNYLTALFL